MLHRFSLHCVIAPCMALACLLAPAAGGSTPVDVSTPRAAVPPNVVTTSSAPMMMLTASKDHTLFGPAYSDFEDLDGDGIIDTTFKPTFTYYGYFDPGKCYTYSTTTSQFNPAAVTISKTVSGTVYPYTCDSAQSYWSGNFLNWSSMTRLDVVRKMLYGGKRSTDTSTSTVLERANLSYDAHSFVKYYRGTDIRDYTPFTTTALTKTTGANANVYAGLSICSTGSADSPTNAPVMRMVKGNVRLWATVEISVCRWSSEYSQGTFGPKLAAYYNDTDKGAGGIKHEISIPSSTADGASYGSGVGPELTLRVKACDASLLGNEHCQAFPPGSSTNFKPYGLLHEFGYSSSGGAVRAEFGLISGSYDKNYTAGALRKNVGDFADEINATTGVFCHNPSSGCSATLAAPDGRTTGNGAIKALDAIQLFGRVGGGYGSQGSPTNIGEGTLPAWGNPIGEMVTQALQYFSYNGTTPTPSNPSSTSKDTSAGAPVQAWQDPLTGTTARDTNRKALYGNAICRPMNILALSSNALSFDGQAATPFATLPNLANGSIASGGVNAYTDKVGLAESLNGSLRSIGSVDLSQNSGYGTSCSAKTVATLSNVSGICPEAPAMGGTYQVAGAALYANTGKIRNITSPPSDLSTVQDALKVKTLAASLTGGSPRIDIPVPGTNPVKYVYITPESIMGGGAIAAPLTFASINSGPTYGAFIVTWNDILMGGDYDMDITGFLRYDLIANAASPSGWDVKVTTDIPGVCGGADGTHGFSIIGVQKAGTTANGRYLTHQHNGNSTAKIMGSMPAITEYLCGDPTYRAKTMTATLTPSASTTALAATVNTTYDDSVCNVTGNGTTYDPNKTSLAGYCTVKPYAYPVSLTFNMVGESNALINDPLWYAAKYGNFKSSTKNSDGTYTEISLPTAQNSWDSLLQDGTSGADGVPDGYFLARRPDLLEVQLRRALNAATSKSNASPATSSARLVNGSYKYVVSFDPNVYNGNLVAYPVLDSGDFDTSPQWQAGQMLGCRTKGGCIGVTGDNGDSRAIITNSGNGSTAGIPFLWASLPAAYITQMTTASTNVLSTTNAQAALAYVRGNRSNESDSNLRQRNDNVLGPIVNSTPWVQNPPAANYFGSGFNGYSTFAANNTARSSLLWVGANDGMLHAFNPNTGAEIFAYVPGMMANRLAEIPLQRNGSITTLNSAKFVTGIESRPSGNIWPYVDGSPFVGEIRLGTDATATAATASAAAAMWHSYLFSSLGRAGRGVFALDVTSATDLAAGATNAASIFKWQFSSDDDTDLGYIPNDFSMNNSSRQPMPIAKLNNGKFAYLIGNGYKSTSGAAALYILFADGPTGTGGTWQSGTDYIKLTANTGPNNGLSQVTWLDLDGDGTTDVAYAGDLLGNMWKFDLSSTTASQWAVAYGTTAAPKPLFTAKSGTTPLPITTAPEYAYGPFDGPVILFGTGNAFESTDYPQTSVNQGVYAIWDRPDFAYATSPRTLPPSDKSTLAARTYARDTSGNVTITGSTSDVNWSTQDGWYVSLPGSSEMVVSDPDLRSRVLVFTTIRPPVNANTCTTRPDSSQFIIDPLSGTAKRNSLGVGVIAVTSLDQKTKVVADATGKSFVVPKIACTAGTAGCTCVGTTCTKPDPSQTSTCGNGQKSPRIVGENTNRSLCFNATPRQQWREIPGLRTDK